ncbi:putative transposable element [Trichonephila clavipes]|nr:putative transposable element [Trichonephila clavipes]
MSKHRYIQKTDCLVCFMGWWNHLVRTSSKNDEGQNVTVNGDRYRAMITNFFIPELNNHDVQELWIQHDGATCHTARATIDLLKDTFGDRIISRFGPVNWPPRSCDLTPLDYFLWSYVKSLVYADKPQTLDHLKDNIRRVIADIRPQMLKKSSKIDGQIGLHPEPAVAVICQKSYLKLNVVSRVNCACVTDLCPTNLMPADQVPPRASRVVAVVRNGKYSFSGRLRGSVGDKVLECIKHCAYLNSSSALSGLWADHHE